MPAFLDGARQLAAALLVLAGYLIVTQGLPVNRSAADARGRWLLRIERPWRLDWGLAANGWLAAHRFPGWLAAWEYATTYVLTTFILWAGCGGAVDSAARCAAAGTRPSPRSAGLQDVAVKVTAAHGPARPRESPGRAERPKLCGPHSNRPCADGTQIGGY
jgi:hypothetical protein